jgi:hypothetical protein
MIATTTDTGDNIETEAGGYLEYSFTLDSTSCGANAGTGGTNSGWQTSTTYTDSGLQTNKCYGYKLTMRDALGNTGAPSTVSTAYTSAATPGAPTVQTSAQNSLTIKNDGNGNPSSNPTTLFAFRVGTSTPTDSSWEDMYVDQNGNPTSTAVWLSDAAWDAMVIHEVSGSTLYELEAKAQNGDGDETPFSSSGSASTLIDAADVPRMQGVRLRGGVQLQ